MWRGERGSGWLYCDNCPIIIHNTSQYSCIVVMCTMYYDGFSQYSLPLGIPRICVSIRPIFGSQNSWTIFAPYSDRNIGRMTKFAFGVCLGRWSWDKTSYANKNKDATYRLWETMFFTHGGFFFVCITLSKGRNKINIFTSVLSEKGKKGIQMISTKAILKNAKKKKLSEHRYERKRRKNVRWTQVSCLVP